MRGKVVVALAALWLALFGFSFAVFLTTAPTGDSFARGLNRVASFMTWQGAAFVVAIAAAFATRLLVGAGDRKSKILGYGPLAVSGFIIVMLVAIIAYTVLIKPAVPA
jgi:hypothetical protein